MLKVGENSYITAAEADKFLQGEAGWERWASLEEGEKEGYLKTAARHIDVLRLAGRKHSIFQDMAFPRDSRREVPAAVKQAQALEALSMTDTEAASRRRLQQQGVTAINIGKVSESYGNSRVCEAAEILSSADALALLRPWLLGSVAVV